MNPKTDLTLMRYCGHFLIKAEGGAKNYKRDHPLPLSWRPFTVVFVQRKGYIYNVYAPGSGTFSIKRRGKTVELFHHRHGKTVELFHHN